ncbi:MAG: cytochrome c [Magnetococcus sp. WYHC-3]
MTAAHVMASPCGGGLGPPLTLERVAGLPPDMLVETILSGRPGTPMPPWRGLLSAVDARYLAQLILKGGLRP